MAMAQIDPVNVPVDILVVSAIPDELDYLLNMNLSWTKPVLYASGNTFRFGKIGNKLRIAAVSANSMGLTPTAITTATALLECKPKLSLMIGTCGGRSEKGLAIGDIVFTDQAFHFQYGSSVNGKLVPEMRVETVNPQLVAIAEHLARKTQTLTHIQNAIPLGFPGAKTVLQCKIGPMACSDLVVKDRRKFSDAVKADRKTISVDMESYAFLKANNHQQTTWAAVIKSVTDFADENKNDDYREYAKYTAAQFALRFIDAFFHNEIQSVPQQSLIANHKIGT